MTITIYHNPNCSNSRKALEIIRAKGIDERSARPEDSAVPLGSEVP